MASSQPDEETKPVQTLEELKNAHREELEWLQMKCSFAKPTTNEPREQYEDSWEHEQLKKLNSKILNTELEAGTDKKSAVHDYKGREKEANELIHFIDHPYLDNPYRQSIIRDIYTQDSKENETTPADAIRDALDQLNEEVAQNTPAESIPDEKEQNAKIERERQEAEKAAKHFQLLLQKQEKERLKDQEEQCKRLAERDQKHEQLADLDKKRQRETQDWIQRLESLPRKHATEPLSPEAFKRHLEFHKQMSRSCTRLAPCDICNRQRASVDHHPPAPATPPASTSRQEEAIRRGMCDSCGHAFADCLCDME